MTAPTALRAVDVSFRYAGERGNALTHVDLVVEPGEMVLVTGASGCGKSTLALVLAGLAPSRVEGQLAGAVLLGDENISDLAANEAAQRVGLVFQNPNLQLFHQLVEAEVAFGPENLRLDRATIDERVTGSLARTGASHLRSGATFSLSGGEKQRIAIAATLAMEPAALILDEPLSDLDPVGAQAVLASLKALRDERRLAIVLIEHRVDEVLEHVDRIVLLERGRVRLDRTASAAFVEVGPWLDTGVAVPEVVQVGHSLPSLFAGQLPMSVSQAASVLAGTEEAGRLLATPVGLPRNRGGSIAAEVVSAWRSVGLSLGRRQVLNHASLELRVGEWLCVIGANGSGKTTLAGLLVGFERPDEGTVEFAGGPVRRGAIAAQAERIGFLLQAADEMLFSRTVGDELSFGPRYRRRQRAGAGDSTASDGPVRLSDGRAGPLTPDGLLAVLGLEGQEGRNPWQLSQGQRQRLALGALLIGAPEVLVLDEPTTGQDARHARAFMSLLEELRELRRLTYLMITHDVRAVARYASRVAVMSDGGVRTDGPPEEIFAQIEVLGSYGVIPPPTARLHLELADRARLPAPDRVQLHVEELVKLFHGGTAPMLPPGAFEPAAGLT